MALCVQIVLLLLLCPLKITATAHFSLVGKELQMNVDLFSMSIVRLRIGIKDGITVKINGRKIENNNDSISTKTLIRIRDYIKNANVSLSVNACALIGILDAATSAIVCALVNMLPDVCVYPYVQGDKCEADAVVRVGINTLQIAKIAFIATFEGGKGYAGRKRIVKGSR